MQRSLIIFLFVLLILTPAHSQEKKKFISVNGYLSSLQSVMFDSLSGHFINDYYLHNRVNLKGYLNDNITFAIEFRNRLFTGDMVKAGKAYADEIAYDRGFADLSWNILNEQSFFLNTTIDRLWFDLNYGKFQARIGRQRINWGQTLVWNPNDIFNVYSFFDFDYIERPGSDAVRLQYYPDPSSSVEFAVKADRLERVTAAAMYKFNKWGYDIQALAGYVSNRDLVAGAGWSGQIGSVSFRGEFSWFQPVRKFADSTGIGIFTTGIDKIFKNNSSVQAQIMLCNKPLKPANFTSIYSGDLTARDLAFSRFSAFSQYTYPVTQLLNLGASAMWFPDLKGFFAGPSLDFSMAENVDFYLIWQHFEYSVSGARNRINLAFLRFKYSF